MVLPQGARRISNIFNKTEAFDMCLWIPEILAASAYLLGEIKVHGTYDERRPSPVSLIVTSTRTTPRW